MCFNGPVFVCFIVVFYCFSLKAHLKEAGVSREGVLQIWIMPMLWVRVVGFIIWHTFGATRNY